MLDEDAFQLHQRLMGDSTANLAAFLPSKRIRVRAAARPEHAM